MDMQTVCISLSLLVSGLPHILNTRLPLPAAFTMPFPACVHQCSPCVCYSPCRADRGDGFSARPISEADMVDAWGTKSQFVPSAQVRMEACARVGDTYSYAE